MVKQNKQHELFMSQVREALRVAEVVARADINDRRLQQFVVKSYEEHAIRALQCAIAVDLDEEAPCVTG